MSEHTKHWRNRDAFIYNQLMLKTFADGRQRIFATAERKMRAHSDQAVRLTIADFRTKG